MNRPRRIFSLPLTALVVLSSSVFLFGSTASAQALEVRPLSANDQIIQQNATEVEQKSNQLDLTASELDQLQAKKDALAQQLDSEKKAIEDLKAKIAAKKEADAEAAKAAAQAREVVAVASSPVSYDATGGCVTGYRSGDYYLDKIIEYESTFNSCATNPGGCFGLLQACPGAPLRAACGGNPACQIAWFQANKTGGRSWAEVWQHELAYGWW